MENSDGKGKILLLHKGIKQYLFGGMGKKGRLRKKGGNVPNGW